MRPWPRSISSQFPLRPDQISTRPWWCVSEETAYSSRLKAVRTDGLVAWSVHYTMTPHFLTELAEKDAEEPVPHPGFRVGQVWIVEAKQIVISGVLEPILPPWDFLSGRRPWTFDVEFRETPIWRFGGRDLNQEQFRELFETPGGDWTAFLAADPACPWLAPWGSK